jgi:diadenosine tetraphosphate (Ap4A) HIT family hydrolase
MNHPLGCTFDRIDDSTCPFESPWHPRRLQPAADNEPLRAGEHGSACSGCAVPDKDAIWANERWRLRSKTETSIPGTVILETRDHLDSFTSLSPVHLAEFGPLVAAIESSLLKLGNVSRVHVSRWGDGSSHFHMYFYPRPRGQLQFRGTFFAVWELMLPPADNGEIKRVERLIAAGMRAQYPSGG